MIGVRPRSCPALRDPHRVHGWKLCHPLLDLLPLRPSTALSESTAEDEHASSDASCSPRLLPHSGPFLIRAGPVHGLPAPPAAVSPSDPYLPPGIRQQQVRC